MRIRLLAVATLTLVCSACQSARIENPVAFNAGEAAFVQRAGKTTIDGHAFVTNSNGATVNAAGQQVFLVPVTAYSRQRFQAIFGARKSIRARNISRVESDPDYIKYTRETKSESSGKFSFDKVGPGEYYVVTQMTWKKDDQLFPDGAQMYETVKITGTEKDSVDVVVSGNASGT